MAETIDFQAALDFATSIIPDVGKVNQVRDAISSLDGQGGAKVGNLFGLLAEGGGRRNAMSICNGTDHDIQLVKWYLHHGHNKVPATPYLLSMRQDDSLFHNAGSWAATGSSGVVTYMLDCQTNLHILWECPYNFDFDDNYIGLMLTSEEDLKKPSKHLFLAMFEDWNSMGKTPRAGNTYDLVCCGPGNGRSKDDGGSKPYGYHRPCEVRDGHYTVFATMGDRHATSSKIVIMNKEIQ